MLNYVNVWIYVYYVRMIVNDLFAYLLLNCF